MRILIALQSVMSSISALRVRSTFVRSIDLLMTSSKMDTPLIHIGLTTESLFSSEEVDVNADMEDTLWKYENAFACLHKRLDLEDRIALLLPVTIAMIRIGEDYTTLYDKIDERCFFERRAFLGQAIRILHAGLSLVRELVFSLAALSEKDEKDLGEFRTMVRDLVDRTIGSAYEDDGYIFGESYDAVDALLELADSLHKRYSHEDSSVRTDEGADELAEGCEGSCGGA